MMGVVPNAQRPRRWLQPVILLAVGMVGAVAHAQETPVQPVQAPAEPVPAVPIPAEPAPPPPIASPTPIEAVPPAQEQESPSAEGAAESEAEETSDEDASASEDASEAESEPEPEDEEDAEEDDGDGEDDDSEEESDGGSDYHHHGAGGIQLPGDLRVNGIFDLAYERWGYTDNLADGKDALRNYHHFLFLRREAKDDPFALDIELVDLLFYELRIRLTKREDPWGVNVRLGKILVPFGYEPLFHHLYGGVTGFDQRFVPAVWSRHGANVQVQHRFGDISVTNDTYIVQGHAISQDDAVINLQTDLAPDDDVNFALGDRVGIAWDAITAWYSIYYSRLGFSRQLLLQAIDIGVWRLPDVPILENLAISIGLARADVSGGTWTADRVPLEHYYHFADYLRLQYFILDWLKVEARTGIVTTNNRNGLYVDPARADVTDVNTHVLGIAASYMGFTATLQHFWRMERRDERKDDFLRLRLSYAF